MKPRVTFFVRFALVLVGLAAARSFAATETAPVAAPHLRIANPDHDFGQITPGKMLDYVVQLSNTGSAPLDISDVRPSCGCTTADHWPHRLAAGEAGTIPVQIDTSEFAGEVVRTLTIVSNDPAQPESTVTFKITAWLPIRVTPRIIILPATADPHQVVSRSAQLTNETTTPVTLSDVQSDNPLFKASVREVTPGKAFELTVTTVPPLPEGTQIGKIQLKTSNAKMPELTVEAVATILPAVQIAPTVITLPASKLKAPETRYIVVLSHTNALTVSNVETNAKGLSIAPTTTPDNKQVTLTLQFPAGFEAPAGEKLYVRGKTNQPTAPTFDIPIESGAE